MRTGQAFHVDDLQAFLVSRIHSYQQGEITEAKKAAIAALQEVSEEVARLEQEIEPAEEED